MRDAGGRRGSPSTARRGGPGRSSGSAATRCLHRGWIVSRTVPSAERTRFSIAPGRRSRSRDTWATAGCPVSPTRPHRWYSAMTVGPTGLRAPPAESVETVPRADPHMLVGQRPDRQGARLGRSGPRPGSRRRRSPATARWAVDPVASRRCTWKKTAPVKTPLSTAMWTGRAGSNSAVGRDVVGLVELGEPDALGLRAPAEVVAGEDPGRDPLDLLDQRVDRVVAVAPLGLGPAQRVARRGLRGTRPSAGIPGSSPGSRRSAPSGQRSSTSKMQ